MAYIGKISHLTRNMWLTNLLHNPVAKNESWLLHCEMAHISTSTFSSPFPQKVLPVQVAT
jgi:hypothetical protein